MESLTAIKNIVLRCILLVILSIQYRTPAGLILRTQDTLLAGGNECVNLICTSFLFPNNML